MTSFGKFRALVGYHASANPWIWVFPLAFAPQAAVSSFNRYYYDLGMANMSTAQLVWLPLLFASFLFGSQIFSGMTGINASTNIQVQTFNAEFLITRAIDRRSIHWARSTIYWALVLIPVLVWLGAAWLKPSFTLVLRPETLHEYASLLPGSVVQEGPSNSNPELFVPWGGLWLRLWGIGVFLFSAALGQIVIFAIIRSRARLWLYWTAFALGVGGMICAMLWGRPVMEKMFFFGMAHVGACVVALVAVIIFAQWFSQRRFLDQEF